MNIFKKFRQRENEIAFIEKKKEILSVIEREFVDLTYWLDFTGEGVGEDDIKVCLQEYSVDEVTAYVKRQIESIKLKGE